MTPVQYSPTILYTTANSTGNDPCVDDVLYGLALDHWIHQPVARGFWHEVRPPGTPPLVAEILRKSNSGLLQDTRNKRAFSNRVWPVDCPLRGFYARGRESGIRKLRFQTLPFHIANVQLHYL
jgi:hypothetical protein